MTDELRPVPGYEGLYSVTRDGRVWSHPKAPQPGRQGRKHDGRWLSPIPTRDGRQQLHLSRNGWKTTRRAHVLAAQAWGNS